MKKNKGFFENYSVSLRKTKNGKELILLRCQDAGGYFYISLPVSLIDKVVREGRQNENAPTYEKIEA